MCCRSFKPLKTRAEVEIAEVQKIIAAAGSAPSSAVGPVSSVALELDMQVVE